jgi:hypothetical protein
LHVQLADLGPRLYPQLGIQVGEGLIHQKHRRIAHDGPPDGNPLPLPTRKFLGLAVEKVLDPKALGHPPNPAFDLRPWQAAQLEAKGHVLGHGHVGVEGIGLEDHGDIPILGGDIVHPSIANVDGAGAHFFQAGQHARGGGFAAAGGADKDEKFPVFDGDVQVMDGGGVSVAHGNVFVGNAGHALNLGSVAHSNPIQSGGQKSNGVRFKFAREGWGSLQRTRFIPA